MNDRNTILVLLIGAVLLEGLLLVRSGLVEWLSSGPHTADEVRAMMFDWRTAASVGLVTVILWLAVRWLRLGAVKADHDTGI